MTPADDLLNFVSAVSGEAYLKVEETLGDGYVRLRVSEAERRQAKHDIRTIEDIVIELLRNSRDAHARRIFIANCREGSHRTLTVIDDGVGVPRAMHEQVFEPRVTSKLDSMVMDQWGVHGRGMALFSIRSNVSTATIAASDTHKGAALVIVADTTQLAERADQSTWPVVDRAEDGSLVVSRGPHNVIRRIVEFAAEHPGLEIYLGTPTEVLATVHTLARAELDAADLLFSDDVDRLPVWQRPAAASDAIELVSVAASLGLPVSERTAHRILGDELAPLDAVLRVALGDDESAPAPAAPDIYRDRRGLKIHHTDLAEFKRALAGAFDPLGERYYIHMRGEPKITVGKNSIRVTFEVDKED